MPDKAWYKEWFNSEYYHLLYNNRNEDEATVFIQKLVKYLNPAAEAKMLDVACGKGRHSKVLADFGYDVTGIDIAPDSIAEAQKDERNNLHFFVHDMRLPFYINYFDFAFNFFTSFGYFKTRREHDDAIRTIANSLHSNGTLVIDYLNVHYSEDHLVKSEIKEVGNVRFHISRWHTEEHFFKQIQLEVDGNLLKHLYTEKVAKFSLGDFTDMLSYQQMQVQEVFGNYELSPYHIRNTPRMIILAKKI